MSLRTPRSLSPLRRDYGLTLIELMVSILLTTLLISGVFFMVSGQQRTYTAQLNTMTAQENIWGAMEYLQGQIRRAGFGFGGCSGEIRAWQSGADLVLRAASFQNGFNLLTNTTDPVGADSFQVLYASDDVGGQLGVKIAVKMPSSSANLKVTAQGGIEDGDLLVIWQPGAAGSWCTLMEATGDPKAEAGGTRYHITHNHGGGKDYNPPGGHNIFPPGGYPIGSIVMRFGGNDRPRSFAIDHARNPPQLVTWQAADQSDLEVIADGIEDMQIAWACDANQDGTITEGRTESERRNPAIDEWAFNVPADVPPSCNLPPGCVPPACTGTIPISMVRISLVARAASPILGDRLGFRPGAEDNPAGSPTDDLTATDNLGTFSRATLTATVSPRNIR